MLDELRDASTPALAGVQLNTAPSQAFEGCDAAVVTASGPLVGGGSRGELFASNAGRVANLVSSVLRLGRPGARVAIVSNPVNALVGHVIRSESCDPRLVSGVVRIDLARARALLARTLGDAKARSAPIVVWGDHSSNIAVDVSDLPVSSESATALDRLLGRRGPDLLSRYGRTAADSIAAATRDHLADWMLGSGHGNPTIAAVWHIDAVDALGAVPYTMPVVSDGERWIPVHHRLPSDLRIAAAMRAAREDIERMWQEHDLELERVGAQS